MNISYETMKMRLTNKKPFALETAMARIDALANNLMITQSEADELEALARKNANGPTLEQRVTATEEALMTLMMADINTEIPVDGTELDSTVDESEPDATENHIDPDMSVKS